MLRVKQWLVASVALSTGGVSLNLLGLVFVKSGHIYIMSISLHDQLSHNDINIILCF